MYQGSSNTWAVKFYYLFNVGYFGLIIAESPVIVRIIVIDYIFIFAK